jgi:two-component system nitrate/nitrite response regulator NarL
MGNTKLLIRSKLVKDALTFVLVAAGFNILSEMAPCDESTVVVIDFDDYADPETLVGHQQNSTKIVVLASRADCQDLDYDQIVQLSGIFTYDLSADALVRSLRLVCSGERVFPRELTLQSNSRPLARGNLPARSDADRLSPREREILSHLTEGRSNKAIARVLGIAEATVKVHLKSLSRKIGVDNRTQAAMWTLANLPKAGSRASREAA